jgi:hypothetical protein
MQAFKEDTSLSNPGRRVYIDGGQLADQKTGDTSMPEIRPSYQVIGCMKHENGVRY